MLCVSRKELKNGTSRGQVVYLNRKKELNMTLKLEEKKERYFLDLHRKFRRGEWYKRTDQWEMNRKIDTKEKGFNGRPEQNYDENDGKIVIENQIDGHMDMIEKAFNNKIL